MLECKSGTGQRELEYLIQNRIYSAQSGQIHNQQFKREEQSIKSQVGEKERVMASEWTEAGIDALCVPASDRNLISVLGLAATLSGCPGH